MKENSASVIERPQRRRLSQALDHHVHTEPVFDRRGETREAILPVGRLGERLQRPVR